MELGVLNQDFIGTNLLESFRDKVGAIPDEIIYSRYLGSGFKVGGVTNSPFRKDRKPSFGVFVDSGHKLVYNDFGNKDSGDTFSFIFKLYQHEGDITLRDMIARFNRDFGDIKDYKRYKNLKTGNRKEVRKATYKRNKDDFELTVSIRDFTKKDEDYWNSYGVSIDTLRLFNVFAISRYFINGTGFKADPLAFVYVEYKDEQYSKKIYQPYNKYNKWLADINFSIHQGYRMLSEKGDILVITKALKDVMSMYDLLKLDSIGLQGEKARLKPSVLQEYRDRFTYVICLFDNDREGNNLSKYFNKYYGLPYILIPSIYECKDFSDLVKDKGGAKASSILRNLIVTKLKLNDVQ